MSKKYTNYNKINDNVFSEDVENSFNDDITKPSDVVEEIDAESTSTKHIGNCSRVYVRKDADKESDPVDILDCGAEVCVLETKNGFVHIACNGIDGWIMEPYLLGD